MSNEEPTGPAWQLISFRMGQGDAQRMRHTAATHCVTWGILLRLGFVLALEHLDGGRPPIDRPTIPRKEPGAERVGAIGLRVTPAEGEQLRHVALRHGMTEAAILRLGAKLVLAEMERDPRPVGYRLGLPPALCGRIQPLPRSRAARGSGQRVRVDGSPVWTPARGSAKAGKGLGKGGQS